MLMGATIVNITIVDIMDHYGQLTIIIHYVNYININYSYMLHVLVHG